MTVFFEQIYANHLCCLSVISSHVMDSQSRTHLIRGLLQDGSPVTNPGTTVSAGSHLHSSGTSFPIIAIAVIGIIATAFLLISYYIFVIKCCLSWHRIDFLRRLSLSRRREATFVVYSPATEPRGLEEAVIRLIPVIQFKKEENREEAGEKSFCECAVCLNEFQQDEKLRMIPNCSHVFHIDCIDIWLQNNANCPLCRTSISMSNRFNKTHLLTPSPSPQALTPHSGHHRVADEDYVVIELGISNGADQTLLEEHERTNSREAPTRPISPSPRKLEHKLVEKKSRKMHKVTSMGDECIDSRGKDDRFAVQPIRRSISMDSSVDRQLYLAVQEAFQQQNRQVIGVSPGPSEGCSTRVKRSFFSFGYGSRSRTAALSDDHLDA